MALLDSVVEGDGLRADASSLASDADVIASVAAEAGAVGVIDYASVGTLPEGIKVLELNTSAAGCIAPSTDGFESRTYAAAAPLFAYVNSASEAAIPLAEALIRAADATATAGFAAPSEAAAAQNASILANSNTGREFTRYVTDFVIPEGANGSVLVAGSSAAIDLADLWSRAITSEFPGLILTSTLQGQPGGITSLCTGAADIAFISGEAGPDLWAACTDNGVEPTVIPLGGRPVVLVANEASEFLACLTPAEIAVALTTDATTWDQVNAEFSSTPVTVVSPTVGSSLSDLLVRLTATPTRSCAPTRLSRMTRCSARRQWPMWKARLRSWTGTISSAWPIAASRVSSW